MKHCKLNKGVKTSILCNALFHPFYFQSRELLFRVATLTSATHCAVCVVLSGKDRVNCLSTCSAQARRKSAKKSLLPPN